MSAIMQVKGVIVYKAAFGLVHCLSTKMLYLSEDWL